jgi:regulator of protease activity HflC (stomatin/prohibitin superfamily)
MSAVIRTSDRSPWLQAGRLTFVALYALTLILAARWLVSNVQQVDPAHRAVVLRFGALSRVHEAGLLWAWPQPFEHVVLIPAAESVIEHHVQTLLRSKEALQAEMSSSDDDEAEPLDDALAGSGFLLTGDTGLVQLDVRVFYKVTAPFEYWIQRDTLQPALERIVSRAAVNVCAARDLDTILVARPEFAEAQTAIAEQRERLRGDLMRDVNARLVALEQSHAGLGIELTRVDVQSKVPQPTVGAFNSVLTSSQMADRNLAEARNDAAWTVQSATQASDRMLQVAQAQASERVAKAQADTAALMQLSQTMRGSVDPGLAMRVYRERMTAGLAKASSVTMIDPKDDSRLIIQGPKR